MDTTQTQFVYENECVKGRIDIDTSDITGNGGIYKASISVCVLGHWSKTQRAHFGRHGVACEWLRAQAKDIADRLLDLLTSLEEANNGDSAEKLKQLLNEHP